MEPGAGAVRRRSVRRLWAGAVLGGLALSLVPRPTGAQEPAGTRIEVEAGYGGLYLPGRRLPVTVTVTADRLVRGSIEVAIPGQPVTWSIDVEVAGGGTSDFLVVVPTPPMEQLRRIDVRLTGAGRAISEQVDVDALEDVQLVGLLPEVRPADLPEPLNLPMDAGTARFVALDPDDLATGGVLDPVGTVVTGRAELGRLDAGSRAQVLDWVDRGGRLVVDTEPGGDVAGLPDEWQPGPSGRVGAGLGEVRTSGGSAAAGRWTEVVEPTPTVSTADLMQMGGPSWAQIEPVSDSVARDAGLSSLDLPWLLFFLLGYVALVGPVTWLVLRRRRASLGWVVVPVLAAVFTAGSFAIGSDLREGTTAAHGTVLETGPAGTRATTVLGLVSRNGRDGQGSFPAGWTAGGIDTTFFGPGAVRAESDLAVRSGGGGVQATVPLGAGSFGALRASGPADSDGGLVVEARSEGDAVVGTVRNDLPFEVLDAGVLLGRSAQRIGRIDAGATEEFRFTGSELGGRDPFSPPEATLWPGESGYGPRPQFDSVVNLGIWNEVHLALGPNAKARGVVSVVGWTRSLATPGSVEGEDDPIGRSAVVGRAPVVSADGSVAAGSVHRELVRGPDAIELPDVDAPLRTVGTLWRFALPAGAGTPALRLDMPGYLGRADVWDGTQWVTVVDNLEQAGNGDIMQVRTGDLPAGAVQDGVVWVRGWLLTDFGGFEGGGLEVRQS